MSDTIDHCRLIADRIAPEIADELLVLDAAELPSLRMRCVYGWAAQEIPREVAECYGDRCRGKNQLVVLDTAAIAADALPGEFRACVEGVFVHELAHEYPLPAVHTPDDSVERRQYFRACVEEFQIPRRQDYDPAHGPKFLRCACHLFARAKAAGYSPAPNAILSLPLVFQDYLIACSSEIAQLRQEPISAIDGTELPAALMAVWSADDDFLKRKTNWSKHANASKT